MIGKIPGLRPLLVVCSILATATLASSGAGSQLSPARLGIIRLDVTRDAWVSAVGQEADGNNGAAPRLKIKSIQEMTLLDVDAAPLGGRTIRSAVLHLKKAGDEPTRARDGQQRRRGVVRGDGQQLCRPARRRDLPPPPASRPPLVDRRGRPVPRRSSATAARPGGWPTPRRPIPTAGSTCRSTRGSSRPAWPASATASSFSTTRARNGPATARRSRFRLFPNRFVYSRDQNRASAPYFTVEPGPDDRQPPAAPRDLRVRARVGPRCRPARRWSRG